MTTNLVWKHSRKSIGSVLVVLALVIGIVIWNDSSKARETKRFDQSTTIGFENIIDYSQYYGFTVSALCSPFESNGSEIIAQMVPNFEREGYRRVFLDLPYQAQGFVDEYISGEVTWDELIDSYQTAFFADNDIAKLNSYKPLIESISETDITLILTSTTYSGNALFLTYPDIPSEYDRDTFIYEFWKKNHRGEGKELLVMDIAHCLDSSIDYLGSFFEIGESGAFVSREPVKEGATSGQLFVKNQGLGDQSALELIHMDNSTSTGIYIFPYADALGGRRQDTTSVLPSPIESTRIIESGQYVQVL